MATLTEIQKQIAALQQQAEEIKSQEYSKNVQEILDKMAAYGLTVSDLQGRKAGSSKKSQKSSNPAPAKFRGPNNETWSGRGLMPRWLSSLVAQGRTKDEFAI